MYIPAPTNFQFVSSHLLISQQHLSPRRDNVWCLATSPLPWLPLLFTHPNTASPPPINSSPCHNMRNMFWLRDQNPNIIPTSLTLKNAQQPPNPGWLPHFPQSPICFPFHLRLKNSTLSPTFIFGCFSILPTHRHIKSRFVSLQYPFHCHLNVWSSS